MQLEQVKQEQLKVELKPGEKLLWSGQPNPLREVLQEGLYSFFFGLVWTPLTLGFTFVWWLSTWRVAGAPNIGTIVVDLYLVPFVLLGFIFLWSPRWAYIRSANTIYGITDQRVMIVIGVKKRMVTSYRNAVADTIKCVERADKTGELSFIQEYYIDGEGSRQHTRVQFIGISEVRAVEAVLREALTVSPEGSAPVLRWRS